MSPSNRQADCFGGRRARWPAKSGCALEWRQLKSWPVSAPGEPLLGPVGLAQMIGAPEPVNKRLTPATCMVDGPRRIAAAADRCPFAAPDPFPPPARQPHTVSFLTGPLPFSLAFVFGCDLVKIESEIAKMNWRAPGEASFGPDLRPRDHRRRRQWVRRRARCGRARKFRFPL